MHYPPLHPRRIPHQSVSLLAFLRPRRAHANSLVRDARGMEEEHNECKLMSECVHARRLAVHIRSACMRMRMRGDVLCISAARSCTQKQYASLRISAYMRSEFVRIHTLTHTHQHISNTNICAYRAIGQHMRASRAHISEPVS